LVSLNGLHFSNVGRDSILVREDIKREIARPVVSDYDDFVVGQYYAIKTKAAGDLNKAGDVGTTSSFVNDGSNNPILDMTDFNLTAEPAAGLYYRCLNQPPSGVANTWGEAVLVHELPSGTVFQPADNANEASFPGKTRCLVKVESISANDLTSFELPVYVDIPWVVYPTL